MSFFPLLAEISDATLGIGPAEALGTEYTLRKSARAILLNANGQIAIQDVTKEFFHKLPGGGVEIGETPAEAVLREIKEEVGCDTRIIRPLGHIIEYRDQYKLLHVSYGFVCEVASEITETAFDKDELAAGQVNIWITPEEALHFFQTDAPTKYQGAFILKRELAYLEEWMRGR
jgi:8-oxo-dGTP diphosphatase